MLNPAIEGLLDDILKVHLCDTVIPDLDEEIINFIKKASKKFNESEYLKIRNKLYMEYSEFLIDDINSKIKELRHEFADIGDSQTEINKLEMKLSELKRGVGAEPKKQTSEIVDTFNKIKELSDYLKCSESDMKHKGKNRFWFKIYPTIMGVLTIIYVGLLTIYRIELNINFTTAIFIYVIIASFLYLLIIWANDKNIGYKSKVEDDVEEEK